MSWVPVPVSIARMRMLSTYLLFVPDILTAAAIVAEEHRCKGIFASLS
jgi:hypothetical protein